MPHKWDPECPEPRNLVRPVRVDPTGETGPTRGQASGQDWRQTSYAYYVPAGTPIDLPEQRILEQSVRLPHGGVVTGWAGCRLHRVGLIDGLAPDGATRLPVPLALGVDGRIRGDDQIVRLYDRLTDADRTSRYGIPCAVIERAAVDAMRIAPDLREAVVVVDMVAAAAKSSVLRMQGYADSHPGCRNIGQARGALALGCEHSRSPNETRLRLVWVLDASLPTPWVNCDILDRNGRLLGIADLRDRALVVDRLRAARGRALFEPEADRRWIARPNAFSAERQLRKKEDMRRLHEFWESQPLPDIEEIRRL